MRDLGASVEEMPGEGQYAEDDVAATVIYEDEGAAVDWAVLQPRQPRIQVVNQPRPRWQRNIAE